MNFKIFCCILFPGLCVAQNLVPNGSFESYSMCPNAAGQIKSAGPWTDPCQEGTADYFNSCCTNFMMYGIPLNFAGTQNAHSGNAYAGIVLFDGSATPSYREYIEVRLTSTLDAGKCYEFELYWSLAEYYSYYQIADIGVYFSAVELQNLPYTTGPISFNPQINNSLNNRPNDSTWKSIKGNYYASGGEQYIIIGNFNANVTDTIVSNSLSQYKLCYFYIDDVSLRLCQDVSTPANTIIQYDLVAETNGCFTLMREDKTQITVWDMQGSIVYEEELVKNVTVCPDLPHGIYGYRIRGRSGNSQMGRLLVSFW